MGPITATKSASFASLAAQWQMGATPTRLVPEGSQAVSFQGGKQQISLGRIMGPYPMGGQLLLCLDGEGPKGYD